MKQQDILKVSGDAKNILKNTKKKNRPECMNILTGGIVPSLEHLYTTIIKKKSVHLIFGLFCMGKLLSALITSPLEPEHVKAEIKSERGRAYSTNILRECIKYTVLFSFFELITE